MELMDGNSGLWGLFVSALLSSTLLPGGSEVLLAYLASEGEHSPWLLLFVATTGNTLGALVTLLMGVLLALGLLKERQFTPRQKRVLLLLQRRGSPLLLLSWLPIIGDILCLMAGVLRLPFLLAMLFIALGKALRYYGIILISG